VVGTTLIFSAVVIATLGCFLLQQIASGLVQNKERSAALLAADGVKVAENQLALRPPVPPAAARAGGLMYQILLTLPQERNAGAARRAVMVNGGRARKANVLGWFQGPYRLRSQHLIGHRPSSGNGTAATSEPTTLNPADGGPRARPGSAPAGPEPPAVLPVPADHRAADPGPGAAGDRRRRAGPGVPAGRDRLAGDPLVVIPVRQAAQGAKLLSTGKLDQRLAVRGRDEVAALATSFNEMAASLAEKMAELQELSLVQRQFVSDVSHELRTPLTTIRIAADVLYASRVQLEPASARSAELLQGQIERFESLLADLLEISRYDANAATLDPEAVDICDVVRNSADDAQQLAERRGTKIQFRLPAGPCVAEVDSRRVARILRNLLVNAVEHGEDKDAMVTVAADRDAVAIAVRDFGVGLAPGEATLVFDRFWRADPARARTSGGTGLGLSIALEDALLHGGWLEAWGEPGRGSVFRLTLPRVTGASLAGSPLPLIPDEAELATVPKEGQDG
jgi:two-component system sensor histidine kinase MtrB